MPQIYIDPVAGNDANDGLTRATALKTFAAVWGHAVVGAAGTSGIPRKVPPITIGIVAPTTGVIRDQLDGTYASPANGWRTLDRATIVEVTGNVAEISCADVARPADFSPHPSVAGAYRIMWTHQFTRTTEHQRYQILVGGERLTRVAESDLRPGSFAYAGNAWTSPTATISIFPFDGYDPRSGSKDVEITRRSNVFAAYGGSVEGVLAHMNADNNGSIVLFGGMSDVRATGAVWGTKHNLGVGAGQVLDSFAANCMEGDFRPDEAFIGNPIVCFDGNLAGKTFRAERCASFTDPGGQRNLVGRNATAFLTHDGSGTGLAAIEMIDWTQARIGCTYLTIPGRATVSGAYAFDSGNDQLFATGAADVTVSRSWLGTGVRWIDGTNIKVRSSLLIAPDASFAGGGVSTLYQNGSIDIQNCIMAAPVAQLSPPAGLLSGGSLTLRNNVISGFGVGFVNAPWSATPAFPVTIHNDYNAITQRSIWSEVRGTAYTLAQFKAAYPGQDVNSTVSASASALGFQSGTEPTQANPDVRITPGSPAATVLVDPITQAEIDRMRARPLTIAAWRTYLKTAPSRRTVKTY